MGQRIEDIDQNFTVKGANDKNIIYLNVMNDAFQIYGFPWLKQDHAFCRLPQDAMHQFNEHLQWLAWHTSGGMIRFITDSPYVSIRVTLAYGYDMSHMPRSGISGFDFYVGSGMNRTFKGTAMPDAGIIEYEAAIHSAQKGNQEWTINFPLYNGVKKLEIGLEPGAMLEKAASFSISKPIAFYGSSITQGGCASRPGNSYPNIISRWLDTEVINLGFSGNGKGEPEMAELISKIDMSAFVLDYDNNAPDINHLEQTHEPFFRIIRKAKPQLPVIFVSKPDFDTDIETNKLRREIIHTTYNNAKSSGDQHVYFVDGETLFGVSDRDACTVDGCHPNDLGFMRMAQTICPVIKLALGL